MPKHNEHRGPVSGYDGRSHWQIGAIRQAEHEAASLGRVERHLLPALKAGRPNSVRKMVEASRWLVYEAAKCDTPPGYRESILGLLTVHLHRAIEAIADPQSVKSKAGSQHRLAGEDGQRRATVYLRQAISRPRHLSERNQTKPAGHPENDGREKQSKGQAYATTQTSVVHRGRCRHRRDMTLALGDLELDAIQYEVASALSHGESQRSISRRLSIPPRQVNDIVAILRRRLDDRP